MLNENTFLFYCSRQISADSDAESVITIAESGPDWRYILDSSLDQNLAPLVYYNLKKLQLLDRIPAEISDQLSAAYYANTARNMKLFAELRRITEALGHAGVQVMILKGAALANSVYSSIGLRYMSDMDLLVRGDSLMTAKNLMLQLGYTYCEYERTEASYLEGHFHLPPFYHSDKEIGVEIHWNIAAKFRVDISRWWSRSLSIDRQGLKVLLPSPEHMIIHLCIHLYHNTYNPARMKRGIGDICQTIMAFSEKIDYRVLASEIEACGTVSIVYPVLSLIKRHVRTVSAILPDDIPSGSRKFFAALEDRLFLASDALGPFIVCLAEDSLTGYLRVLSNALFPDTGVICKQYNAAPHSAKMYYGYLAHFIKILNKYSGKLSFLFQKHKPGDAIK